MAKTRTGNHIFLIRCWSLTWRGSDHDDGEMSATALSTGGLDKILTREVTIRYRASFLICCFICSVCGGSSCDERSDKYRAQQACDLRGFYNAALLLSFKVLKLWCGGSSCDYDTLQIFLMAECLIVGGKWARLSDGWKSLYVLTVIDSSLLWCCHCGCTCCPFHSICYTCYGLQRMTRQLTEDSFLTCVSQQVLSQFILIGAPVSCHDNQRNIETRES